LKAKAFSPLINLRKLHISDWPSLNTIDTDAFEGLTQLTYLSLWSCGLTKVPERVLATLTALRQLNLGNNPLMLDKATFSNMEKLEELYLSGIGTHFLHESPFTFMSSLHTLDLSNNEIEVLPNHLFLQLSGLRTLNISHNRMVTLSQDTLEPLIHLHTIDVSTNPLVCDCNLKWLRRKQESRIRERFELDGVCTNPRAYNGTLIAAIPQWRFSCDPPSFDSAEETVKVRVHRKTEVVCRPSGGNPEPEIQWEIQLDLPENQNKRITSDGRLVIDVVKEEDLTNYECVATNDHGIMKHSILLVSRAGSDDNKTTGHDPPGLTVMIVTLIGVALLALLVCYKRKAHVLLRRRIFNRYLTF